MTDPSPPAGEAPATPAGILRRLNLLIDLCTQRFRDDFVQKTTIEDLTARLRAAEAGQFRLYLQPFIVGTAMVIDRLDGYAGADPQVAAALRDELLELFELYGIHEIPCEGRFDPARHEAVQIRTDLAAEPGTIVARIRRGFSHDGWVFRASRVAVSR
jgi:molecular chaperone GrpE (heat shock protein)